MLYMSVISTLSIRNIPAVYAAGLNFHCHAREVGLEHKIGKYPIVTMKSPTSVVTKCMVQRDIPKPVLPSLAAVSLHSRPCPESRIPINIPRCLQDTPEVDYEGELAVIIGKQCKDVSKERAWDVISGVTCAVDVTARRWQGKKGGGQWSYSKSFDTFCPLGPVSARFETPEALRAATITTVLNGQVMQQASLGDMIFDVPTLVSFLSQGTTLDVGTVILCGTPAGVGYRQQPPRYLQHKDELEVNITHVGTLKCLVEAA